MKNKTLYFIIAIFIIALGLFIGLGRHNKNVNADGKSVGHLMIEEKHFDFGDIPIMGGTVTHTFEIKNTSSSSVMVSDMETSCMCTTVYLNNDGKRSPMFGMRSHGMNPRNWSTEIAPGETATLDVIFDPMAHGPNATGPIHRVVSIYTNDNSNQKIDVSVSGNVTK